MPVFISKQDLIESTGQERLEELKDLEILFLTFEEISSLQYCPNLVRLSLIDNGLTRISNLQPVSTTLKILCLCDQKISQIENLELPNLRELYLHRNRITCVTNLQHCTKLKKLWLFQNQITSLVGLLSLTSLEELWVQSNQLSTLSGIENLSNLKSFQLAGNPICEINEILRITRYCPQIIDFSLFDIHFGICPLMEERGMKEYILQQFPKLIYMDGVKLSSSMLSNAHNVQEQFYLQYEQERCTIMEQCQAQLRDIDLQHQSKESYTQLLEKEMSAALKELFSLVDEGRSVISKEVQKSEELIQSNYLSLTNNLQSLEVSIQENIQEELYTLSDQYTVTSLILQLLEGMEVLYHRIVEILATSTALASNNSNNNNNLNAAQVIAYQIINPNAADFLMMAHQIDPSLYATITTTIAKESSVEEESGSQKLQTSTTPRRKPLGTPGKSIPSLSKPTNDESIVTTAMLEDENGMKIPMKVIELARLFKVVSPSSKSLPSYAVGTSMEKQRIFTIMSIDEFQTYSIDGWKGVYQKQYSIHGTPLNTPSIPPPTAGIVHADQQSAMLTPKYAQLFSNDASMLLYLYEESGLLQFQPTSSPNATTSATENTLESMMKNIIKHANASSSSSTTTTQGNVGNKKQRTPSVPSTNNVLVPNTVEIIGKHAVLVSFQAYIPSAWINHNKLPVLPIPYYAHQKNQLVQELTAPNTATTNTTAATTRIYAIRNRSLLMTPANGHTQSVLYSIPILACDSTTAATGTSSVLNTIHLQAEFVCQCIMHIPMNILDFSMISATPIHTVTPRAANHFYTTMDVQDGSMKKLPLLKGLEARLEVLLYPTHNLSSSNHLLTNYEHQVQGEVKRYVDKLLVEVNETEALVLEQTEKEISSRDAQMRRLREEIEKERRIQEQQLRELRSIATNENSTTGSGNNTNTSGGGMVKNASSKNIRR